MSPPLPAPVSPGTIRRRRLGAQQLTRRDFDSPLELVQWLGAVQAQDYAGVKWALGLRLEHGATETAVERAISVGEVLRTHALRGTWQLVAPADIRWIVGLVGPLVLARNARRYQELELDERTLRRGTEVIVAALGRGEHLVRDELATALERARISTAGPRLSHLLARAELEGLVCSGRRRGKRATHALLDERAPSARALARDEALAELARRYFRSRGPARLEDFAWWAGLSVGEARSGLESVRGELASDSTRGGARLYGAAAPAAAASGEAHLLPAFDEYLVAYRHRDAVVDAVAARRLAGANGMLSPVVLVDGRVVGTWRRELARGLVAIDLELFRPPTRAQERSIAEAARGYATFLGLEASIAGLGSRGRTPRSATLARDSRPRGRRRRPR